MRNRQAGKPRSRPNHWREKGFTILDEQPHWDAGRVELRYLRTADGESVTDLAVTDPAQWAVLVAEEEAWVDPETGEAVDESTIDGDTEINADATPVEGMRHFNSVTDGVVFVPTFYCLDYSAAGFTLDSWFSRNAGLGTPAADQYGNTVDLDGDDAAKARSGCRAGTGRRPAPRTQEGDRAQPARRRGHGGPARLREQAVAA